MPNGIRQAQPCLPQQLIQQKKGQGFPHSGKRCGRNRAEEGGQQHPGNTLRVEGDHRHIIARQQHRKEERRQPQKPHKRRKIGSLGVVIQRVEMLGEEVGRDHHIGAAVHHNAHSALRQLGAQGIGALGGARPAEKRRRPLADERLQKAAVQHQRQRSLPQFLPHGLHRFGRRHIAEVAKAHIGAALPAQVQRFHRQIGGFEPAAHHGGIGIVAFGKALPGAAEVLLHGGLPHAPCLKALIAQRERPGHTIQHHHGKAAHRLGKEILVGFHDALLAAEQKL